MILVTGATGWNGMAVLREFAQTDILTLDERRATLQINDLSLNWMHMGRHELNSLP